LRRREARLVTLAPSLLLALVGLHSPTSRLFAEPTPPADPAATASASSESVASWEESGTEQPAAVVTCDEPQPWSYFFTQGGAPAADVPPADRAPNELSGPPLPPGPPLAFDRALGVPHTPFGKQIYGVALRYSLNPLVVAAIVEAESDFNPRAISRKGARGLMQVMPATGRRFGYRRRDLLNPRKNLEAGARYLRWLTDHFGGDALRVLAAYNAGEGSVERFGGLPPFPETRDYVQRIFTRLGYAIVLPAIDAAAATVGAR
jgi:hypothetical protein